MVQLRSRYLSRGLAVSQLPMQPHIYNAYDGYHVKHAQGTRCGTDSHITRRQRALGQSMAGIFRNMSTLGYSLGQMAERLTMGIMRHLPSYRRGVGVRRDSPFEIFKTRHPASFGQYRTPLIGLSMPPSLPKFRSSVLGLEK
ncbi:hypothetical protein AG1IA_01855 [Rhizoctonia solani AG-1 IA]|uniref:Uncharacterized protein n=1 Tax=Thanatephorus cucumeris (strain AG1-IA) TaxID=983506 RepID=L8X1K9_THACA|nr:hypothetical protein AG1IA_01855 [Rhizoctonia solani AG-1 IA]